MDIWDAEGAQRAIYADGGFDPDEHVDAFDLAAGLGVPITYRHFVGGGASYCPWGERERVYLDPRMSPHRQRWLILHELSERHTFQERGDEGHELACNRIAARLRAPRGAFRRLVEAYGLEDLAALSRESGQSQTSTGMRIGEVFDVPVTIVTPGHVHVRGPEWGWPDERELRRLTLARSMPRELRRVKLDDAKRRYMLIAA